MVLLVRAKLPSLLTHLCLPAIRAARWHVQTSDAGPESAQARHESLERMDYYTKTQTAIAKQSQTKGKISAINSEALLSRIPAGLCSSSSPLPSEGPAGILERKTGTGFCPVTHIGRGQLKQVPESSRSLPTAFLQFFFWISWISPLANLKAMSNLSKPVPV